MTTNSSRLTEYSRRLKYVPPERKGSAISHIATIDIIVKDLPALKAAAEELGLELCCGVTNYRWFGELIADSPLPPGMRPEDCGKCDHVLRIPGNAEAYEIGVVKNPDGSFALRWDFYDGGYGLEQMVGQNAGKLVAGLRGAGGDETLASPGIFSTAFAARGRQGQAPAEAMIMDSANAIQVPQPRDCEIIAASTVVNAFAQRIVLGPDERSLYETAMRLLEGAFARASVKP